jgi:hypothetical protein
MAHNEEFFKLKGLVEYNIGSGYPNLPVPKQDTIYYAIQQNYIGWRMKRKPESFVPTPVYYAWRFYHVGKKNQRLAREFNMNGMLLFETAEDALNGISYLLDEEIQMHKNHILVQENCIKEIQQFRQEYRL